MRITFPQGTPIEDQIGRRPKVSTGRKHTGAPRPGRPPKQVDPFKVKRMKQHKKRVAAYWRGDVDEYKP
jgi:hypothetical protein